MSMLDKLIEEQRLRGLSDRAFAHQLGISQALWSNTKRGKTAIGLKILGVVARDFPLLGNDIIKYLVEGSGLDLARKSVPGNKG